jgi:chaperone BCS1
MRQKMALSSILGTAFPSRENVSDPLTGPATNISPTTLLETFIPGYGPIHKFLLYTFGFDVTVLVSLGAILWLGGRIGRSVWTVIWALIAANWMAEVSVSSSDEIHAHLLQFLAHQYRTKSSRRLMAETPTKSAWELDSEDAENLETTVDADGNIKWLNFSNQEAKTQPIFTPAIGNHSFWHDGTYFTLRRKEVTLFDELGGGGAATLKDKEILTLSCFGRSTEPIKALIQHAKSHYHLGHNAKTIIKRPAPKDMRRFGGRGSWVKIAERPCRPMKTVVLDEERKMDVLADINEYLNPATARWYANRGIPYRRGYLFHGPPGTGKTSLTFALAGVFGLDIHVISLLEPTLTEEELGMLFTNLPARCIVLLEDIDTAGLLRNDPESDESKKVDGDSSSNQNFNVVNLTKALRKAQEQSEEERKKGISLSGLLNIIDGTSSFAPFCSWGPAPKPLSSLRSISQ